MLLNFRPVHLGHGQPEMDRGTPLTGGHSGTTRAKSRAQHDTGVPRSCRALRRLPSAPAEQGLLAAEHRQSFKGRI